MSAPDTPRRRIRILTEEVANMIAAGEVVERPASVVKELVENALDAGARAVEIEIAGGGRDRIRVADDGCGMDRDDALLSLERHATSKLAGPDDLERIATLGFRGEALASIAGVSRFSLETWDGQGSDGTLIEVHGGWVAQVAAGAPRAGTRIEVRSLFFNVPARRKFLRRPETEAAHVHEMVARLALPYPEVHFRLLDEGRLMLDCPAGGPLLERIRRLFGTAAAEGLVELVPGRDGPLAVSGAVSLPAAGRSHARQIRFWLNRRAIRDRLAAAALYAPYRGLLPEGRHPAACLLLSMPPEMVDVNVHPAKAEVRFRDPDAVRRAVTAAVAAALRRELAGRAPGGYRAESFDPGPGGAADGEAGGLVLAHLHRGRRPGAQPVEKTAERLPGPPEERLGAGESAPPAALTPAEPRLIGQFGSTYLLVEAGPDLLILDQHTAHERLLYERLGSRAGAPPRQLLLAPQPLDLSPAAADALLGAAEELRRLGYDVEPFGPRSVLVTAVPGLDLGCDAAALLADVAEDLAGGGDLARLALGIERVRASLACRAAVRAGRRLPEAAARELAAQILSGRWPTTCPHGRPIVVTVTGRTIAGLFDRGAR